MYKGTKVAEATVMDHHLCMSEIHKSHKFGITDDVSKAKQHQLWEVAGKTSSDLTDIQHHQLFVLYLRLEDSEGKLGSVVAPEILKRKFFLHCTVGLLLGT